MNDKLIEAFHNYVKARENAIKTRDKTLAEKIKKLQKEEDKLGIKIADLEEEADKTIEPKLYEKMLQTKANLKKVRLSLPKRKL